MLENLDNELQLSSCKVRTYYESLDKKDAELLKSYIDDEQKWTSYALCNALRKRGVIIDYKLISKHREGLCSCKEYYARQSATS